MPMTAATAPRRGPSQRLKIEVNIPATMLMLNPQIRKQTGRQISVAWFVYVTLPDVQLLSVADEF